MHFLTAWVHFKVLSRYLCIQLYFYWSQNESVSWVPAGQEVWGKDQVRESFLYTRPKYINERLKRRKTVLNSIPERTRSSGNIWKWGKFFVLERRLDAIFCTCWRLGNCGGQKEGSCNREGKRLLRHGWRLQQ